jgi:hypothetical protein
MRLGDFVWGLALAGITALLILPTTHAIFIVGTLTHPYLMGFIKFAILASMGELLALRVLSGTWSLPTGFWYKALVWGGIGVLITLMFVIFSSGIAGAIAKGLLPHGTGWLKVFIPAALVSYIMNYTFGPVFMAVHRISDVWIDTRIETGKTLSIGQIVDKIEWPAFIKFVVGRTVPFFWGPAHTLTFLLPPEYRVLVAAYLGIALGLILAYARRKTVQTSKETSAA